MFAWLLHHPSKPLQIPEETNAKPQFNEKGEQYFYLFI